MTQYSAAQRERLSRIGAFLRETREKHEKSLNDITVHTFIRPPILAALEAADLDRLPEPVYVQGFIRRYAEALGLNGLDLAQQFTGSESIAPRVAASDLSSRTTPGIPSGRDRISPPPAGLVPTNDFNGSPEAASQPSQNREALTIPTLTPDAEPDAADRNGDPAEPLAVQFHSAAIAAEPALPSDPPDFTPPAPVAGPAIAYSSTAPSVSAGARRSANLTPYALAGLLALLVVGAVALLTNLSGSRSAVEVEPVAELDVSEAVEPPAPPVAPPEVAPPEPAAPPALVSDAPVYVSVDTTGNAWISVIADGRKVFEGTLPAGESQLWEAQQSIDVFTGNAGAVLLSHNGSEPAVMGELGKTRQAVYTADSAE